MVILGVRFSIHAVHRSIKLTKTTDFWYLISSYSLPFDFELTSKENIEFPVNIIRNFLNYLLYHNVCPEYQEQIESSKRLCDQAERELLAISLCVLDLPGTFNKACSELYGGVFQGQWAAASTWLTEEESASLSQGISPAHARQAFKLGIVANTSEEQFKNYEMQSATDTINVTNVEDVSLEVIGTVPPDPEIQSLYASRGSLDPVGK